MPRSLDMSGTDWMRGRHMCFDCGAERVPPAREVTGSRSQIGSHMLVFPRCFIAYHCSRLPHQDEAAAAHDSQRQFR